MAVFKAINSGTKSRQGLRNVLKYVLQDEKTNSKLISSSGLFDVLDYELNADNIFLNFRSTAMDFDKWGSGRVYLHFTQAFAPTEGNPEIIHKIGLEFAEKVFPDNQVLVVTHEDKGHLHNHFIVNAVSQVDGHKFNMSKRDLQTMKDICNQLTSSYDLSIPEKGKTYEGEDRIDEVTAWNKDKYQILKKGVEGKIKAFLIEAMQAVDRVLNGRYANQGLNENTTAYEYYKNEFIGGMERQEYKVNWSEKRKNVTLTDAKGNKIRMSNLAKTFGAKIGTKEEIIYEMENQANKRRTVDESKERDGSREANRDVVSEKYGRDANRGNGYGEIGKVQRRNKDKDSSRDVRFNEQGRNSRSTGVRGNNYFSSEMGEGGIKSTARGTKGRDIETLIRKREALQRDTEYAFSEHRNALEVANSIGASGKFSSKPKRQERGR